MRNSFLSFVLLTAGLACAQAPAVSQASTQAGTEGSPIQGPVIGVIDYYGVNKASPERIRRALGVKVGDPLPASKSDIEERLDEVPNIVNSHLEAICCEGGKVILYVGVEETGAPHFDLREEPEGDAKLPDSVFGEYRRFLDALATAARRGVTAQDETNGYALSADPLTREIQMKFPALASENIRDIRDVLRSSYDEEQRAAAAYIAAYNPRKEDALADMQTALRDSDPGVRGVAADAIIALIVYARLHPDDELKIAPTWFIEMLNSLSWSDRQHAMKALDLLTESHDDAVLTQLRERALSALVDMARWQTPQHALPAFVLVGRIAGLTDPQIHDAFAKGDRETVIRAALAKRKSR